jgi:hypothetical protein
MAKYFKEGETPHFATQLFFMPYKIWAKMFFHTADIEVLLPGAPTGISKSFTQGSIAQVARGNEGGTV